MPAILFCFSNAQTGSLQQYIKNLVQLKGMNVATAYTNYPDTLWTNHVECDSARQALIMSSCYLKKNENCTIFIGLFYTDINNLTTDISVFSSQVSSNIILYTDTIALGLNKLSNVNKYHVHIENGHFGIAPVTQLSAASESSVSCRCHNNKVGIFWICTGCGSVYCRLVPNCGKCGSRFIFSKGTPGF